MGAKGRPGASTDRNYPGIREAGAGIQRNRPDTGASCATYCGGMTQHSMATTLGSGCVGPTGPRGVAQYNHLPQRYNNFFAWCRRIVSAMSKVHGTNKICAPTFYSSMSKVQGTNWS